MGGVFLLADLFFSFKIISSDITKRVIRKSAWNTERQEKKEILQRDFDKRIATEGERDIPGSCDRGKQFGWEKMCGFVRICTTRTRGETNKQTNLNKTIKKATGALPKNLFQEKKSETK